MLNTFQQNPHAMLPKPTHDEAARQSFVKSFRGHLAAKVMPASSGTSGPIGPFSSTETPSTSQKPAAWIAPTLAGLM